jgi:hypothetical protein
LHPRAARADNQWLDVNFLREGDYVYRVYRPDHSVYSLTGKPTVNYNLVQIKKFTQVNKPNVRVFGLHFHEGLQSYHANG